MVGAKGPNVSATVLLADDEADIRRLATFLLGKRGYDVIEFSRGDDAFNAIKAKMPDIVVLDVMMPGMTGPEIVEAMRTDPTTSSIPVVMMSAKGRENDIQAGLDMGATSYVVKPFAPSDLVAEVARVLSGADQ